MSLPVACALTEPELQERRANLLKNVRTAVLEGKEMENGYAYRFPSDEKWIAELANLISLERRCCPFLNFDLKLEPGFGPIWLELTGPPGTREFLNSLFD
ncbi:MAG TPA: hypothetical protein VGN86_03580 [Pyrinomonadaceae bacterium]|nr:hypothetical protein [Pyrinomonadaceae bacterium]